MKLEGTRVVLTGTFDTNKVEIQKALESMGAIIEESVDFGTGVVFSGDNPGRAFDQAMELGIPVRDERELAAALAGQAAPKRTVAAYDDMIIPTDMDDDEPFMDFDEMPRELSLDERPTPPDHDTHTTQTSSRGTAPTAQDGGDFEKGSRVKIIGGAQGVGVVGTIFWWGESKWGEGMRAGVSGDDDETYWVDSIHLGSPDEEVAEEAVELAKQASAFGRGDRVKVISGRDAGSEGTIFWWGESKWGNGMRAGVETDAGKKIWADASELAAATGVASTSSPQASYQDDDIPF